jgi:hypothetical protein
VPFGEYGGVAGCETGILSACIDSKILSWAARPQVSITAYIFRHFNQLLAYRLRIHTELDTSLTEIESCTFAYAILGSPTPPALRSAN